MPATLEIDEYVCLNSQFTYFKILALCLPPNIWVSSHAPMRHQAPNIWVSQHLFGHPGLGQDLRACVGKVLRTFAHIASLCYASYLGKILVRIYLPLNAEAVSAVKVVDNLFVYLSSNSSRYKKHGWDLLGGVPPYRNHPNGSHIYL